MQKEEFEKVAQEVFESLPDTFRMAIDNVRIIVEEGVPDLKVGRRGYHPGGILLGLYEGIPLSRRGPAYGMYPILPDTITLFKSSIEAIARSDGEVRLILRDTLIHEIGHYFGMSERQIRDAGY
jgi:predicted Zn-dependent protease with MMP-like domain